MRDATGELCFDVEGTQVPLKVDIKKDLKHEMTWIEQYPWKNFKSAKYSVASLLTGSTTYKVLQDNLVLYEGDLVRVEFQMPYQNLIDPIKYSNTLSSTGMGVEMRLTLTESSLWS